jgi:hypothetical protein
VKPLDINVYNVNDLKPVHYTNKLTNKEDIGLIAHELQQYMPFLVKGEKDGESNQSVNYIGLIGILIAEIQDLKRQINQDLKKRIEVLEKN